MKFLTIIIQKFPPPPEMMPALVEGVKQWMDWAKKSGKFEVIYAVAGQPGGLGIAKVDSLEELNDIIQSYPLTPFCEVQTFPLSDIDRALSTWGEQVKKMAGKSG